MIFRGFNPPPASPALGILPVEVFGTQDLILSFSESCILKEALSVAFLENTQRDNF
jgi:hypothetical protein